MIGLLGYCFSPAVPHSSGPRTRPLEIPRRHRTSTLSFLIYGAGINLLGINCLDAGFYFPTRQAVVAISTLSAVPFVKKFSVTLASTWMGTAYISEPQGPY